MLSPDCTFERTQNYKLTDFIELDRIRQEMGVTKGIRTYNHLANKDYATGLVLTTDPKVCEYIVVGPRLYGIEIGKLYYYVAPQKQFGLDTKDVLKDQYDLYHQRKDQSDEDFQQLLARHQHMPGWSLFEEYALPYRDVIEKSRGAIHLKLRKDSARPIFWWRDNEGKKEWVDIDQDRLAFLTTKFRLEGEKLNPVFGWMILAAYSPDVVRSWGKNRNYMGVTSHHWLIGRGFQNMGPNQSSQLVIMERQSLLQSELLEELQSQIESSRK